MERTDIASVLIRDGGLGLVVRNQAHDGNPENWGFPGGCREPGETLAEAAAREAFEEVGVVVDVGRLLRVDEFVERNDLVFLFDASILRGTPSLQGGDPDVVELRWVEAPEAEVLMPWYANGVSSLLAGSETLYRAHR